MADRNPFLKPKASSLNLEVNLPTTRDLGLTSEDRILDPLRQERNKAEKEMNNQNSGITSRLPNDFDSKISLSNPNNIGNTLLETASVSNPNVDFNQVDGKDISGPSSDAKKGSGKTGQQLAGAGLAALGEAPNIINQLGTTPESTKEAQGKALSLAASGAAIGMSFGPIGALAGGIVGGVAGIISNRDWKGKKVRKEDAALEKKLGEEQAERTQNYFMNKTAEQIEAELNIFKEAQGILS